MPSPLLSTALLLSLFLVPARAEETPPFRLPSGNAEAGLQAFLDLQCVQCHGVKGLTIQHPDLHRRIDLNLAEAPRFVNGYHTLLTAITNPRHVIQERYRALLSGLQREETEPFMPDLTSTMSVRQLLDLLAFLDEQYARELPSYQSPSK